MPRTAHLIAHRPVVTALAGAAVLAACALALATPAHAIVLRAPQVVLDPGPLQSWLNSRGEAINVATDQLDAQTWDASLAPGNVFTLVLADRHLAGAICEYDGLATTPVPRAVLSADAPPGAYAVLHFGTGGTLWVGQFMPNGDFIGQTVFPGVDPDHVAFCLQDAQGTFYAQDARNGGAAQELTYVSIYGCAYPCSLGNWYLCFEGAPYSPTSTFTSVVMELQTMEVLPARASTWGALKNLYH